jgi:putative GTP pyrophosphokinase
LATEVSKTQIDKLGDRLKKGEITEADLRLLDDYRRSFSEVYEFVVDAMRTKLAVEPTGRPAKSTTSIAEKLLRESIRLTQVQDIAGCRLIVSEMADQDRLVESLKNIFVGATVVDRREHPSHGYRAVHVVVKQSDKLVEIQVRTSLQHLWAELSEKLSDVVDSAIKYGKGDKGIVDVLLNSSDLVAQEEMEEANLANLEKRVSDMLFKGKLAEDRKQEWIRLQREINEAQKSQVSIRERSIMFLKEAIDRVPKKE